MEKKLFGAMGTILKIDMSTLTTSEWHPEYEFYKKYFGGISMGARLIYDLVPPKCDPLGPENKIVITASPLVGTPAPACSLVNVASKSPLYNGFLGAQINGFFGHRIKKSGYDGIIIENSSDKWVYVTILDNKVEFHDAEEVGIMGKGTLETEKILKEKYGSKVSVMTIGQAGENLVKYAAIEADHGHFAASGGPGAVMGSKKLKAIVVGIGNHKITIRDMDAFRVAVKSWVTSVNNDSGTLGLRIAGTNSTISGMFQMGMIPVKNCMTNQFDISKLDGISFHKTTKNMKFTRDGCYGCPIAHCNTVEFVDGKYKGVVGDEAEMEGLGGFGCNLLIDNPEDALYLSCINDEMGMDLKESIFICSWAAECFEKGILTLEDTDGLEIRWGDPDCYEVLLRRMAAREGKFGEILANGLYYACHYFGEESAKCAVYAKSHGPHGHDPRGMFSLLINQSVSDMGSTETAHTTETPECQLYKSYNPMQDRLGAAFASGRTAQRNMWRDSYLACMYTDNKSTTQQQIDVINTVVDFEYTPYDAMDVGKRAVALMRAFNTRAGLTRKDDNASYRMLCDSADGGLGKGIRWVEWFEAIKSAFYLGFGFELETTKPLPDMLCRIGLGDVCIDLWGDDPSTYPKQKELDVIEDYADEFMKLVLPAGAIPEDMEF